MYIVLIIFLVILGFALKDVFTKNQSVIDEYEEDYDDVKEATYLGGFPDISINNDMCSLIFLQDKIKMIFTQNKQVKVVKEVRNEDIIDVSFVTEKYITDQINVGALICFGWLGAIALKDKKHINKEYVMVKLKYDEKEIGVIFDGRFLLDTNETLLNRIKEQIELRAIN